MSPHPDDDVPIAPAATDTKIQCQDRLRLLTDISRMSNSGLPSNGIIAHTIRQLGQILPHLRVSYSLIDAVDKLTVCYSTQPPERSDLTGLVFDLKSIPPYLKILRENAPLIVENVVEDSRLASLPEVTLSSSIRAFIGLPVFHSDKLCGLLLFDAARPRQWSERETTILGEVAEHLSLVNRKAQMDRERGRVEESLRTSMREMEIAYKQAIVYARELKAGLAQRNRAEKALRESEQRYRLLFNSGTDAVFVHHLAPDGTLGKFIEVNEVACQRLGYAREELLTLSPLDVDAMEKRANIPILVDMILTRKHALFETVHLTKDKRRIPVEVNAHLFHLDDRPTILSVARDISSRKQAEDKIRRRNRELYMLNRVIAATVADLEPDQILETACRELAQGLGVPHATAALITKDKTSPVLATEYGSDDLPAVWIDTIPAVDNPLIQLLVEQNAPLIIHDAQNDSRLAPVRTMVRQYGVASMLIVPLFIERKLAGGLSLETKVPYSFSREEVSLACRVADQVAGALNRAQLAADHERLITAIEQVAESIIITDIQGTILYVNPAFEQITGYPQDEAVGRTPRLLKSGEHDQAFYQELWATISAGKVWYGRLVNRKKNGDFYSGDTTISPVRDKEGHIINYVGVQRDVTSELQLEEQYRQAQKMEAVGRLAGGIAHDFNNILSIIDGHTEFLLDRCPDLPPPAYREIEQIKEAGEQAAMLTRQLLAFSRRRPLRPQAFNPNTIIKELKRMLNRLIGEDIELITRFEPALQPIKAEAGHIEQVIMNLAINARDAMPDGGRLLLETANVEIDDSDCPEITPGRYVMLTVSDTGLGIDQETQAHIFEPFFTTKKPGQGTGLGLATVYSIVRQSGGYIRVFSEIGQGTCFRIYFPATKEVIPKAVEQQSSFFPSEGSKTVLLAEDEAGVRLITRRIVQKHGYHVLEAGSAAEALDMCKQPQVEIDLLITDMVLPDMSGHELANEMIKVCPQLKVIYTSGYGNDILTGQEISLSELEFLEKPFSAEELISRINRLLSTPARSENS